MSVNIGINIQRSPNRINQQLREAGVGGKYPKLLLDFADNYYLANGGSKTLANAVTHARAGNATMTDGYGPELVVNGGFTSDSDWTKGTGWSIANGVASSDGSQSSSSALQAVDILTIGKTYVVTFTVVSRSAGSITARAGTNGVGTGRTATGTYTEIITCAGTDDLRMTASNDFVGSIDNVSVREMPVLKWAPHNLLSYSEDFSNAAWSDASAGTTTVTPNSQTAPDGTETADTLVGDNNNTWVYQNKPASLKQAATYTFRVWLKAPISQSLTLIWYNPGGEATSSKSVDVTTEWQLFEHTVTYTTSTGNFGPVLNIGDGKTFYAWGAHAYRSDLGGMVDNPDQPPSRASYVPTTSSAKYLPRIGHHVYNGSAWVNEGVLAESEARTNLLTQSNDFVDWDQKRSVTVTADSVTSPDGTSNGSTITSNTSNDFHFVEDYTLSASTSYAFSVFVKYDGYHLAFTGSGIGGAGESPIFDLQNGTVDVGSTTTIVKSATIEDVGNGWYRCGVRFTTGASPNSINIALSSSTTDNTAPAFTGDGTSGIYVYGAQLEQTTGEISSYIPTSGSSVTRAAETFTIPSANLPWPTPQIIGSELADTSTVSVDSPSGTVVGGQSISLSGTSVYQVDVTISNFVSGDLRLEFKSGTLTSYFDTSQTFYLVPVGGGNVQFRTLGTTELDVAISVREINPLSVSIGMEGRITFANTWTSGTKQALRFFSWRIDNDNKLLLKADSTDASGERLTSTHEVNNVADFATFNDFVYEGVLQSVNVALRVGSTFFQVAANGQTGAENATLTSLVDLSATDLDLVDDDYMGTIGTFRVWDKDLGDAGIVEATNPSLEPSLSLTFEGTGTNSFTVSDWSE